jgi:hypothetical protein
MVWCEEGVLLEKARGLLDEEERRKIVNVKWRENNKGKNKKEKKKTKRDRDATTSQMSAAGRGNGAEKSRCRTEKAQLQNGNKKSVVEQETKGRGGGCKTRRGAKDETKRLVQNSAPKKPRNRVAATVKTSELRQG